MIEIAVNPVICRSFIIPLYQMFMSCLINFIMQFNTAGAMSSVHLTHHHHMVMFPVLFLPLLLQEIALCGLNRPTVHVDTCSKQLIITTHVHPVMPHVQSFWSLKCGHHMYFFHHVRFVKLWQNSIDVLHSLMYRSCLLLK